MQRVVVILSPELDFCLLLCFYLEKKGCTPCYRNTLSEGLEVIEQRQPAIIVADGDISLNLQTKLTDKINSIPDYHPHIFWVGIPDPQPYGYKLKRPEPQNRSLLDELVDELKRLLEKWSKKR